MRIFLTIAAVTLATGAAVAAPPSHIARETVIHGADNGGLRSWQAGPSGSGVIYVRDSREQWYQVTLSGPCGTDTALDKMVYTTDRAGTFDTFSKVTLGAGYASQVCGVTSIRASTPPAGQPGAKKT